MEKQARKSEDAKTWFRSERVYLADQGMWYFRTREGVDIGPYDSQFEAEIESGLFSELLREVRGQIDIEAVIREFVLDSCALGHELKPFFHQAAQATG